MEKKEIQGRKKVKNRDRGREKRERKRGREIDE